jgi:quercetin 2,3-dioxygenase
MTDGREATRQVIEVLRGAPRHWVGDGFPVRSLFSYPRHGETLSPFLLLDYGGPTEFPPTEEHLGVGEHPHRGFETVTIVYDGEVEHRDSAGGGGLIGPGDVQWMTAGAGIVHEEFHGREYARKGGPFEMVQLWVNLPAKVKMTEPGYQAILDSRIPRVEISGGLVRVIAGNYAGTKGAANTFSPLNVWDVRLKEGAAANLPVPEGHNAGLVVLTGRVKLAGGESAGHAEVAVYEREGGGIQVTAEQDAKALLLSGEPLNEPIVGHGPFVMNTSEQIRQAMVDYATGKMGHLT